MKIVYIANTAIPSHAANNVHIMKMCQAFAKNDQEVVLILPDLKHKEIEIKGNIYDFYGVENCFEIKKISLPRTKGFSFIYAIKSALVAKKEKPDLIYSRFLRGSYMSSFLKISLVHESHDIPKKFLDKLFFSRLIKSKNLKNIVVITNALKEYYKKKYNLSNEKIFVVPDGADAINQNRKPLNIRSGNYDLHVGYIGQLYKGRGMNIISKLVKNMPKVKFNIVGGVPSDLEYWKKKLKKYKNVTFYGYKPHSETTEYMLSFDVLVAPYQKEVSVYGGGGDTVMWMSPLKIFEYMSAGKPIIASDLPVLREVLIDKKNSLLCDPENINEWIEALEKLKDKSFRNLLGENAKREFLEKYTWKKRAENILKNININE
jgi:glycosyltransferase involved in cell wall biosynthesis